MGAKAGNNNAAGPHKKSDGIVKRGAKTGAKVGLGLAATQGAIVGGITRSTKVGAAAAALSMPANVGKAALVGAGIGYAAKKMSKSK